MKKRYCLIIITLIFQAIILPINVTSYTSDKLIDNSITNFSSSNPSSTIDAFENETILVHNMEVNIRLDNSLKIISSFVLANNDSEPLEYFTYTIDQNISSVFSFDPIDSLPFTWVIDPVLGNIINVSMRYPLLQNDIYVFSISYELLNEIYQVFEPNEYFGLDYEFEHTRSAATFNLEVILPLYGELLEEGTISPVNPSPTRISTEDARVTILWSIEDVEIDDNDLFLVRYFISATLSPKANPFLLALYFVLTFLGGAALTTLGFYFLYRVKFKPVESELVSSLLSKSEQEVIKAINLDDGVSTQRRICDKTGFSKSKVSQILSKLEEKDVLTRERWGRTNKVTITNPSFRNVGQEEKTQEN